jgi:DNA-binding NtrC family response regulator
MTEGPDVTLQNLGLEKRRDERPHQPKESDSELPLLPESGIDLNALEEPYIKEAIKKARGNDSEAANMLGMSYYAFRYRKKKPKTLL